MDLLTAPGMRTTWAVIVPTSASNNGLIVAAWRFWGQQVDRRYIESDPFVAASDAVQAVLLGPLLKARSRREEGGQHSETNLFDPERLASIATCTAILIEKS